MELHSGQTESKTGDNSKFLCLAHFQPPDGFDRQHDNHKIRDNVAHEDELEHQDLIHAVPDPIDSPLLLHWRTEENKHEGEDETPQQDNSAEDVDPDFEPVSERSVVETQLAEPQSC